MKSIERDKINRMVELLEEIQHSGSYAMFNCIVGSCISCDNNETEEQLTKNTRNLSIIIKAIEEMKEPPQEFLEHISSIIRHIERFG